MGGIRVDADSQMTNIKGLFACGECAAGLHGANRLGGNSLSDLIVFGKLAGDGAAEYIKGLESAPAADDEQIASIVKIGTAPLNRETGPNPFVLHEKLQDIMGEHVGIIRKGESLEEGITKLEALGEEIAQVRAAASPQFNAAWNEALDLRNMLTTGLAVARAALLREESRGAHTREDFEGEREDWGKVNIVTTLAEDGSMSMQKVDRPDPPEDLEKIARASLEELETKNG
jgi:succinate dehydrogenase / fumarate reductase flavoprotein subunit